MKRCSADLPHARWENNLFETASRKTLYSDPLEPVGELNIFQASTICKRPVPNTSESFGESDLREADARTEYLVPGYPQLTFLLKDCTFKVNAFLKRALPNFLDIPWDDYLFYPCVVKASESNFLQFASGSESHAFQMPAHAESVTAYDSNAVRNGDLLNLRPTKAAPSNFLQPASSRECHALQALAATECVWSDLLHASGDFYTLGLAVPEPVVSDPFEAFRNDE